MKFATHVMYVTDPAKADALRPRHRAYLAGLHEQGKLLLAGPFADNSGGLFIHEAGDEAEVRALLASDPFAIGGVFDTVITKPWKVVFSHADAFILPG